MSLSIEGVLLLLSLFVSLFSLGCAGAPEEGAAAQDGVLQDEVVSMDISGKSILMVIAPEGFRDEEFLEPEAVFERAGADVTVASKGVSVAKGKLGATAEVDIDISDVNVEDYDAVVFIGGPGASVYFDDPTALKIAKDAYAAGKVAAAICIAPSILANAGVLKGRKATCFESESGNVGEKSAGYTGEPVTVDGLIVTANGPAAAKRFGQEIVKLLS
ncbi:DJ-1/PfpI family protein [Candidatus Woesearchaeota archaeon]|nr:DJ-1/PfpI family protein [Candidatus Woesearchaeota archaeon]